MTPSLFLAAFAIYLKTACGTISCDDSGEICLAAAQLSVLHPPGYPIFAAIARIWAEIPVGCIAFRMNVLSSALSAGTVSCIFALWRRVMPAYPWAGWFAALLAGCATALWSQSGTAKGAIYSLNSILTVGAFAALLSAGSSRKAAGKAAILTGLALAHHWMSALGLAAALAVSAVGGRLRGRAVLLVAIMPLLALSAYLWLPVRAADRPFLNWGRGDNFQRLKSVVMREQYGKGDSDKLALGERFAQVSESLSRAAPWPAVCGMAAAGAAFLYRSNPGFAAAVSAFLIVLYGSLFYYGAIRSGAPWYMDIFSIPGALLVISAASLGFVRLWDLWAGKRLPVLPSLILGILVFMTVNSRWHECDRSTEYLTHDLAVNLADSDRGKRLLLANSDVVVFGNWELWRILGRNRGLYAVPAPLLPQPWIAISFSSAVPGLRAPYPGPRTGAESVPALMKAWSLANERDFGILTFKTDASRAAFAGAGTRVNGLTVKVGGEAASGACPPERLRFRGLFGRELGREPRLQATFQPIYFSGFLSWANELSDADPGSASFLAGLSRPLAASSRDKALVNLASGNIKIRTGLVEEALVFYREACAQDPVLGAAWRNLAVAQLSLGRMREAEDTYRKFKLAAPESEELAELGGILSELERGRAVKR